MATTDSDTGRASGSLYLISRSAVRRYLLDYARDTRAHRFTRVSPAVYARVNRLVVEACQGIVRTQPSAGKTIA